MTLYRQASAIVGNGRASCDAHFGYRAVRGSTLSARRAGIQQPPKATTARRLLHLIRRGAPVMCRIWPRRQRIAARGEHPSAGAAVVVVMKLRAIYRADTIIMIQTRRIRSPRNPPFTKSAGLFGEGEKRDRAARPSSQLRLFRRQSPSLGERQSPVILAIFAGRRHCAVNRKRGGSRGGRIWLPK